jgi:hypothetical protein
MSTSLSRGQQIAGAAAAVLLIDMFLSWYGLDLGPLEGVAGGLDTTASAWQAFDFIDLLLLLTVLATGAWVGAAATNNELAGQLKLAATGLGALCTLLVLYRIVNQPGPNDVIQVKYGVFVGLLACAAITYGAVTDDSDGV